MAIEYERVNWDTTMFVKPTNMNHMDAGIKAACDGVDENSSAITAINSTLQNLIKVKTATIGTINNVTSSTVEIGKQITITLDEGYQAIAVVPRLSNNVGNLSFYVSSPATGKIQVFACFRGAYNQASVTLYADVIEILA